MQYDSLPTWSDLQRKVDANEPLDPVEQFIYDEESASPHDTDWRKKLEAALYFYGGAPLKIVVSAPSASSNTGSMSAAQIFADGEVALFMGQMADAFAEFCKKVNDGRRKLHTA